MDIQSVMTAVSYQQRLAENDYEVGAALARCQASLQAIAWERFRLRHEAACAARAASKKRILFVRRHKSH